MNQDNQLPSRPKLGGPREFTPNASTLPPLDHGAPGSFMSNSHDNDRHSAGWSPSMIIAIIFVGSFIVGVLFTASILAGYIEIQPSVIKGFFKSLLGKT